MYNIVIVEDHKLLRDMIKDSLENEEVFNVVATLSDAKDVFEVCKEYKPDLVLMDICTENNSNGVTYSKVLKENFPEREDFYILESPGNCIREIPDETRAAFQVCYQTEGETARGEGYTLYLVRME